jgi:hypothetical protein
VERSAVVFVSFVDDGDWWELGWEHGLRGATVCSSSSSFFFFFLLWVGCRGRRWRERWIEQFFDCV